MPAPQATPAAVRSAWQYLLPEQVHADCREAQVYRYVRIFIHTVCDTTYVMVRFPNPAITDCFTGSTDSELSELLCLSGLSSVSEPCFSGDSRPFMTEFGFRTRCGTGYSVMMFRHLAGRLWAVQTRFDQRKMAAIMAHGGVVFISSSTSRAVWLIVRFYSGRHPPPYQGSGGRAFPHR